jgi:hypothetical protein
MLYYIKRDLQYGNGIVAKGSVHSLSGLPQRNRDILEDKGIIAVFHVPPLDQLPGWHLRAKRFDRHGVDVHRFFALSDDEIAAIIGSRSYVIARWRKELRQLLGLNRAHVRRG